MTQVLPLGSCAPPASCSKLYNFSRRTSAEVDGTPSQELPVPNLSWGYPALFSFLQPFGVPQYVWARLCESRRPTISGKGCKVVQMKKGYMEGRSGGNGAERHLSVYQRVHVRKWCKRGLKENLWQWCERCKFQIERAGCGKKLKGALAKVILCSGMKEHGCVWTGCASEGPRSGVRGPEYIGMVWLKGVTTWVWQEFRRALVTFPFLGALLISLRQGSQDFSFYYYLLFFNPEDSLWGT